MLDERALRKPDLDEPNSVPVVLADGQTWLLPKPWLVFAPVVRAGQVEVGAVRTLGADFDEQLAKIDAAETELHVAEGLFGLGVLMLSRNYALGDADYLRLLHYRIGDETNLAMWKAILDVARGTTDVPKASPAGSDAPSS